ncbi:unnamed protein product [Urochloa humidicola]
MGDLNPRKHPASPGLLGGGTTMPNKRHRAAAGDSDADGNHGAHDGEEPVDSSGSGEEEYYFDDDGDGSIVSISEETDDDGVTTNGAGGGRVKNPHRRHGHAAAAVVLTEDDVRRRQEEVIARVAELLSFPAGFAAALLRHFKWDAGRVEERWFSDDRRIRAAVGLPPEGVPVPTSLLTTAAAGDSSPTCGICFAGAGGEMRSAACGAHFYCGECWRGYIAAAVGDGAARCLSLRCPEPTCAAAVVRELVDAAAAAADRARYARFLLRSFVDDGAAAAGHRIKWCPAPACNRAVELAAGIAGDAGAADVFCACRHGFCWRCGEEAHRPVSCDTVRAWLDKNNSYSETANWVLDNTKPCPKCLLPLEKDQGCMHMTCPPPCGHEFCWVCLDPWHDHRLCPGFREDNGGEDGDEDDTANGGGNREKDYREELNRRLMNASDRYLYHYERWIANFSSLEKVIKDMEELESTEIERIAAMAELPEREFGFLTAAYEQIADGRRVLKWAYAYGYYLDPARDAVRRGLFEDLLDQANAWLEKLHAAAELERKETFCAAAEPAVIRELLLGYYKGRVENFTSVTRTFLGNLVKAFETTDLPRLSHG